MAEKPKEEIRRVSLTITIRVNSISTPEAQALEDSIRDIVSDSGADVTAMRGTERPGLKP